MTPAVSGLAKLVRVSNLQALTQFMGGILDGVNPCLQDRRQTKFVLPGQAPDELQHQRIDLQRGAAWHHLQQIG